MDKNQKTILALSLVIIGILLLAVKSSMVSIIVTVAGAVFIVLGVIDLCHTLWAKGIVKAVAGILLVVFGWLFAAAMIYVFGALLIAYGLYLAYLFIANKAKPKDALSIIMEICLPILSVACGILLFFNTNVVFTIAGILLIIVGLVMILQQYVFKKQ